MADGDYIRVRATQAGWYPNTASYGKPGTKMPGDEFFITHEKHFSHTWMVRLSPPPAPVAMEVAKKVENIMAAPVPFVGEPADKPKRKYTRKAKVGE